MASNLRYLSEHLSVQYIGRKPKKQERNMEYQTMKFAIIIPSEIRTGNNEQNVKVRFGCYAEIENRGEKHII